jgi:hypothetical protein
MYLFVSYDFMDQSERLDNNRTCYRLRSVDIGTLGAFSEASLYLVRVFWHSSQHGFTVTRQSFCLHSLGANLLAGRMEHMDSRRSCILWRMLLMVSEGNPLTTEPVGSHVHKRKDLAKKSRHVPGVSTLQLRHVQAVYFTMHS